MISVSLANGIIVRDFQKCMIEGNFNYHNSRRSSQTAIGTLIDSQGKNSNKMYGEGKYF